MLTKKQTQKRRKNPQKTHTQTQHIQLTWYVSITDLIKLWNPGKQCLFLIRHMPSLSYAPNCSFVLCLWKLFETNSLHVCHGRTGSNSIMENFHRNEFYHPSGCMSARAGFALTLSKYWGEVVHRGLPRTYYTPIISTHYPWSMNDPPSVTGEVDSAISVLISTLFFSFSWR